MTWWNQMWMDWRGGIRQRYYFKDKFELKNVKSQMTHKINLELKIS